MFSCFRFVKWCMWLWLWVITHGVAVRESFVISDSHLTLHGQDVSSSLPLRVRIGWEGWKITHTHTHADTVCCTVPLILTIYGYYHVLHVRPSLTQAGRKLTSPQKTKQYMQGKPYSVCAYNTNREPIWCVQDYWICRKRKIWLVKAKSNFVVLSSSLCFIVRDISKQIQLNGHKTIIGSLCDWSSLRIIVSCNFLGAFPVHIKLKKGKNVKHLVHLKNISQNPYSDIPLDAGPRIMCGVKGIFSLRGSV